MQPEITALCAAIRYQHRQRVYAMGQRIRADLALGSFLRMILGWKKDGPKAEMEAIRVKVASLIEIGEKCFKQEARPVQKRKAVEGDDDPLFVEWRNLITASVQARKPFDDIEGAATKEMERLASQLPVWSDFGQAVRGLGLRSLAIIVAEAGDLSNYPKKGHLWKRMGVAVIDGTRQGGLLKTAPKAEWIEHGYNRQRRSYIFVIGDNMVKMGDAYRRVYLDRKEYERQRAVDAGLIVAPSAKIPAKRQHEFICDGHIHRRAKRYMEKRLLRDLWQAWNHRKAIKDFPPEDILVESTGDTHEREAIGCAPESKQASAYLPTAHLQAAE